MRPTSIHTFDAAELPSVAVAGNIYTVITSGKQTGGAFATIDMQVSPNGGPMPHAHPDMEESFFVLEGEVVFKSETQTYTATKGALIHIPLGGAVHCFKNESGKEARLLCIVKPAGLDDFFLQAGTPIRKGEIMPPEKPPTDADKKRLMALAEKYGQQLFPPDYFETLNATDL